MGTIIWSPLASGMLTGRVRRGQESDLRRTRLFEALRDERRIDAVEQLIPLADEAGLSLTHMALAFVIAHPGVTSALIGPRTPEQLDDLLAAAEVTLSDDLLDRIDGIVPPGTGVGRMDQEYNTPPIAISTLRRRPAAERSAA
jgi:aryl-alcohol dehydrogenase-like predicted oxidoreductase